MYAKLDNQICGLGFMKVCCALVQIHVCKGCIFTPFIIYILYCSFTGNLYFCLQRETRILDAPNIKNDYYLNVMDWGKNNILAIALGSELYLWNSENGGVQKLLQVGANDYPTSLAWSGDAKTMAVGYLNSGLQIWDAETSKLVKHYLCMFSAFFEILFIFFGFKGSDYLYA